MADVCQNEVYLETEVSQDTGNVQETEETEAGERLDILDVSGGEQTGSVDLSEVSAEEWAAEVALAPETTEDADKADRASGKCYVYVCGEVAEPGVYALHSETDLRGGRDGGRHDGGCRDVRSQSCGERVRRTHGVYS